eukprot:sb/3476821/
MLGVMCHIRTVYSCCRNGLEKKSIIQKYGDPDQYKLLQADFKRFEEHPNIRKFFRRDGYTMKQLSHPRILLTLDVTRSKLRYASEFESFVISLVISLCCCNFSDTCRGCRTPI